MPKDEIEDKITSNAGTSKPDTGKKHYLSSSIILGFNR
jgi:hypothetical protein